MMGFDHPVRDLKKTTAWKWFSHFIRLRDCITKDYAQCASCGKRYYWKQMDAGHYMKAIYKQVFFDEHNVSAQCKHCNMYLDGNSAAHRKTLVNRWGEKEVLRIESLRGPRRYYPHELKEISDKYRLKVKQIERGK